MELPDIPMHTLSNLSDEELLRHIESCDHPVIQSLYSRFASLIDSSEDMSDFEDDLSEKELRIDELKNIISDLLGDIAEEDKDMKESQADALLDALKIKPMTQHEIYIELGIWNSGARINELRGVGHAIETKMVDYIGVRWGKTKVAQYIFHEVVEQAA